MVKNKVLKITLLSLLIAFLLAVMIAGLIMGNSFFEIGMTGKTIYDTKFNEAEISKITTDLISTDITLKNSEDKDIRVVISAKEDKDRYNVEIQDGVLKISQKKKMRIHFISFGFVREKVTIYLPQEFNKDLKIVTISGDVTFDLDVNSNLDLKTTSGDIKVKNCNNLDATSVSGDISIGKGSIMNISTTSGEIKVEDATSMNGSSVSGDIKANSLIDVKLKTISGDIKIGSINLTKDGSIKTTSGNVNIDETNDIYIGANSKSGNINISNNNRNAEHSLIIDTTSGDIKVK